MANVSRYKMQLADGKTERVYGILRDRCPAFVAHHAEQRSYSDSPEEDLKAEIWDFLTDRPTLPSFTDNLDLAAEFLDAQGWYGPTRQGV